MTDTLLLLVTLTDTKADAKTVTEVVVAVVVTAVEVATTIAPKTVPTMALLAPKLLLASPTAVAEIMDEKIATVAADRRLEDMRQATAEPTLELQVQSFLSKLLSIPQMYFQIVNFA